MSVIYVPTGDAPLVARGVRHSTAPSLSVVVASIGPREALETALVPLVEAAAAASAEVLVVRADAPARLADLARLFNGIRFVVAPPGAPREELLALGMSEASGHVVELIDDSRLPLEDWTEVLSHRIGVLRPGPGITRDGIDWMAHLLSEGVTAPAPPAVGGC